jgi:ABC-type antimicrobial peptide transport system permease subunit
MTEDARSLLTLLALIIGSGLVTMLVIWALAHYAFKENDDE